jgi:2-polyprenyl-3-methyl-5-hydroxy-6-metoxy-1,4-benzoquinol methylase
MRLRPSKVKKMSWTRQLPSIEDQRHFWDWHWQHWQERRVLNDWTERRAQEILDLIKNLPLNRPRILDLGCGHGWFTERLAGFGQVHGIDLSQEAIAAALARRPDISYLATNIYEWPLPESYFDLVVSQEVIAHVEDQSKYLDVATKILRVGGYLIVTTGNKFVLDRLGDVGWNVQPAQHIAHQLSLGQLKKMLAPRYKILRAFTIIPHGSRGILRLVNSYKLNSVARWFVSQKKINQLKERAGFGWQMIVLAQKKV